MACTPNLPVIDYPYWEDRQKICTDCEHRNDDTCTVVEAKHPGRSSIKNGVMRKSLECPSGKWKAIPSQCPVCNRKYGIISTGICIWCQNERNVANANARRRQKKRRIEPIRPLKRPPRVAVVLKPRKKESWCVAITTAPRQNCTLQRCLNSIERAGWESDEMWLFAEPGSTKTSYIPRINNETKRGAWHNWLYSCRRALEMETDFILTVQDDSHFHSDSRELIESIEWPQHCAFVSLYTPAHYSFLHRRWQPKGVRSVYTRSLWGACALVWRREVLEKVIEHKIAKTWLGASARTIETKKKHPDHIANVDTAIGKICNAMGLAMYFVDPSPVTHVATHSTLKHGGNSGRRNAIRPAVLSKPLIPQVFV
jgi:hypothetical protein